VFPGPSLEIWTETRRFTCRGLGDCKSRTRLWPGLILNFGHAVAYDYPPLSCRFHRTLPAHRSRQAAVGAGLDSLLLLLNDLLGVGKQVRQSEKGP